MFGIQASSSTGVLLQNKIEPIVGSRIRQIYQRQPLRVDLVALSDNDPSHNGESVMSDASLSFEKETAS